MAGTYAGSGRASPPSRLWRWMFPRPRLVMLESASFAYVLAVPRDWSHERTRSFASALRFDLLAGGVAVLPDGVSLRWCESPVRWEPTEEVD